MILSIDDLNRIQRTRDILDSPQYRVYDAAVTRKELLAKPDLSATERRRIRALLLKHRLLPIDATIAAHVSQLLTN